MGCKKIFIDSDVLLDLLLERQPFFYYSRALLTGDIRKLFDINTSTLIVANIHYIIRKNLNKSAATDSVKYIMSALNVLPFEANHINSIIELNQVDFEDSLQYQIAKGNECELIISRNIKHYKKFDIPVLTAEEFLKQII